MCEGDAATRLELEGTREPGGNKVQPPHAGLVLAAGAGMRLRPITETCPKPLLALSNGQVILDSIATNANRMGLERLKVIAREHEPQFRRACRDVAARSGIEISLAMLPTPTSSSLETLRFGLRDVADPPAVFLGDDVTISASTMNLVEAFVRTNPAILQAVTQEEDKLVLKRSCAVTIDGAGRIKRIDEKPAVPSSNVRGCGIYILGERACQVIRDVDAATIHEITELVDFFARGGQAAYEFIAGTNINVNTPEDLAHAQQVHGMIQSRPRPNS